MDSSATKFRYSRRTGAAFSVLVECSGIRGVLKEEQVNCYVSEEYKMIWNDLICQILIYSGDK